MMNDQTGWLSRAVLRQIADRSQRRDRARAAVLAVLDGDSRDPRRDLLDLGYAPDDTSSALRDLEQERLIELRDYRYQIVRS